MYTNKERNNLCMDEYNALRSEILALQDRKANAWLQMYALFLTLFAFGWQFSSALIVTTYIVLIPYQAKLNNFEWNVSRISAYIRVFYESEDPGMRWETLNTSYAPYTKYFKKRLMKLPGILKNAASIHLALFATFGYISKVILDHYNDNEPLYGEPLEWALALLSVILLVIVYVKNKHKTVLCDDELVQLMIRYKKQCDAGQIAPLRNNLDEDDDKPSKVK